MISPSDTSGAVQEQQTAGHRAARKAAAVGKAQEQNSPPELRRACQQFEEIFLRLVFKEAHLERSLSSTEDKANLYGDLIIETLAKSAASGGGIGIGEMLYRELTGGQATAGGLRPFLPDNDKSASEK